MKRKISSNPKAQHRKLKNRGTGAQKRAARIKRNAFFAKLCEKQKKEGKGYLTVPARLVA